MKCWGYNFWGQLGDNSATARLIPVNVSGLIETGEVLATCRCNSETAALK